MIEIPLNNSPEQLFDITLNGTVYSIRVILNSRTGIWGISLSRGSEEIVNGVPLLSGVDIFGQYNIGISNVYVVNLDNSRRDPNKEGLGTSSRLFLLTDEEVEGVSSV